MAGWTASTTWAGCTASVRSRSRPTSRSSTSRGRVGSGRDAGVRWRPPPTASATTIEQMPPAEYLASRYYERWLWAAERMAAEQGLLDGSATARGARPSTAEPAGPGASRPASACASATPRRRAHARTPVCSQPRRHGRARRVRLAQPGELGRHRPHGTVEHVYSVAFPARPLRRRRRPQVLVDVGESDLEEHE